jgi:hypothetical protein
MPEAGSIRLDRTGLKNNVSIAHLSKEFHSRMRFKWLKKDGKGARIDTRHNYNSEFGS